MYLFKDKYYTEASFEAKEDYFLMGLQRSEKFVRKHAWKLRIRGWRNKLTT